MENKVQVLETESWPPSETRPREDLPGPKANNQDEKLSILKRLFYRPSIPQQSHSDGGQATSSSKSQRRFSFRSRRCLALIGISIMLIVIIVVVLSTLLARNSRAKASLSPPMPGSPSNFVPESPIQRTNLHGVNFPDPFLYQSSGKWYTLGTNNAAGILDAPNNTFAQDYGDSNIQLASSTDLVHWTLSPESTTKVLADSGHWSISGTNTVGKAPPVPKASDWAPDIYKQTGASGDLLLYYTAASAERPGRHCIGVASTPASNGPAGPFVPTSADPLICPLAQGGAIDPATFVDSPSNTTNTTTSADTPLYLVYKVDGNTLGHGGECGNTVPPLAPTPLMLQRLDAASSGLRTAADSPPVQLLARSDADGPLIEAPALVRSAQGVYFLFFSSGCTRANDYDVKYATADRVDGPYARAPAPLLKTGDYGGLVAPGSVSVSRGMEGEGWVMAFAARVQSQFGGVRELFVTGLELDGKVAKVVELGS
ncbi:MAG: hypothetical protein M1821_004643 [Bathelium mastoideum]|nr:MAG: hypothetical protein M1821_004643 [Bathelium mastoideum]